MNLVEYVVEFVLLVVAFALAVCLLQLVGYEPDAEDAEVPSPLEQNLAADSHEGMEVDLSSWKLSPIVGIKELGDDIRSYGSQPHGDEEWQSKTEEWARYLDLLAEAAAES